MSYVFYTLLGLIMILLIREVKDGLKRRKWGENPK